MTVPELPDAIVARDMETVGPVGRRRLWVGDGLLFVLARLIDGRWHYARTSERWSDGKEVLFQPTHYLAPGSAGAGPQAIAPVPIEVPGDAWHAGNADLRARLSLLLIERRRAGDRTIADLEALAFEAGPIFCAAMIARLLEEKA